jgi:hypothetical protein
LKCVWHTDQWVGGGILVAVLAAKTQYNLNNAREYFEEHLCVGDYYDEGQRVSGEWLGLGAQRLGLAGRVRADDFLRLCENQHPATGETLTQRLNTTRADADGSAANRRSFYDFTFSPPKSVSLAGFLGEDARVLDAHARAVKSAGDSSPSQIKCSTVFGSASRARLPLRLETDCTSRRIARCSQAGASPTVSLSP